MDLIIINDGLVTLVPVTKALLADLKIIAKINCFDLCDILRVKLSTYADYPINEHIMKDGSGNFIGCVCN
tara:strand:+ start:151 stop:360 length:210 start_codon:yes stop_codon:yes gene_type:complete